MNKFFWLLAAMCTAYYSTKLIFLAFYAVPLGYKSRMLYVSESGLFIVFL
jgi:hypothetical protein